MSCDPRHRILFEPIKIGPVTARNRFYQTPHTSGMGAQYPNYAIKYREMKAEGGWGVVCSEMCTVHPASDIAPYSADRLWCDEDIEQLALLAAAIHKHGALAGCELVHEGSSAANRVTRERAIGPSSINARAVPTQVRAMDREEIQQVRQWHRDAAKRAQAAGFDIVYVYASHGLGLPGDFLSGRRNRRDDEYGGTLENRVRLLRELIEDTKDAIGDRCAIAVRFGVDEVLGEEGFTCRDDGRRVVELLAEAPDLWDVNVNNLNFDLMTSRFTEEGFQEPFVSFVKQLTDKPVVGVGRFTSPDTMVSMIRRGILDFIGAARPTIADPFLPRKIETGETDDIRECIGCNVCLATMYQGAPIRCTQNPTVGEEWRRGWHPERIGLRKSDRKILVVGAGPAGLEAARSLGNRGYEVALAEATRELGGRVVRESRMPGLQKWIRVRDYRVQQIRKMANVGVFLDSTLTAEEIVGLGYSGVIVATGSRWRRDGIARATPKGAVLAEHAPILTPDDVFEDTSIPDGPVVVYDDENYYLGGVIAEFLRRRGAPVTLVTPECEASTLLRASCEKDAVQTRLLELGIVIMANKRLSSVRRDRVDFTCVFTGRPATLDAACLVLVCMREPNDVLLRELRGHPKAAESLETIIAIGDAFAPGTIAEAVYAGHKTAREFDETAIAGLGYRIERTILTPSDY